MKLSIKAQSVSGQKTKFSHRHQLDTSLPPRGESLGRCIAGQQVARLYIGWYGEF